MSKDVTKIKEKDKTKNLTHNKFARTRWRIFKNINRVYWVIAIFVIVALGFMTYQLKSKYENTLHWQKNDPAMTMANQSLDLLYDKDPESKASKIKFDKLRSTLLASDGQLTPLATRSEVKKLKRLLDKINLKTSEKDYKKLYAEVALKYSLNLQYEDLFSDSNQTLINKDVTPATISRLNETTFNDLQELFLANNSDKFVSTYLANLNNLLSDSDSFNNLIDTFNGAVSTDNKVLTLKDGYHSDLSTAYDTAKKQLKFNWSYTLYMNNIVSMLKPVVTKTINAYDAFNSYQLDMKKKDEAYESWKATQDDFFAQVNAIHTQAIAEKRAREEAERIAKALEAAKLPAKDIIDKYMNLTQTQRDDFKKQVDNAGTIETLNKVVDSAKKADDKAKADSDKADADKAKADADAEKAKADADAKNKENNVDKN